MMNQLQRCAQQRVLAQEALGKLKAITELFGTEDHVTTTGLYLAWEEKLKEFEEWIWDESPIA